MKKLKITVCFGWIFFVVVLIFQEIYLSVPGQAKEIESVESNTTEIADKPEFAEIESFDKAVQQRFLTQPSFGVSRILPAFPPNPHLRNFSPVNDEERNSVDFFRKEGWKVGIYLFGKRTYPETTNGKEKVKFTVYYRLNKPIAVTPNLKERTLRPP